MLNSQLEIISRGIDYLQKVTCEQYNQVVEGLFISSAGAHMRHIIDHYDALRFGLADHYINYDIRSRGSDLQRNPVAAKQRLLQVAQWLEQLAEVEMDQSMTLSTEVSVSDKQVVEVPTSLARELVFVGSHAIHHFAMIAQIAKHQELALDEDFALAPATATMLRDILREQQSCAH